MVTSQKSSIGNIVNLLAVDTACIENSFHLIGYLIVSPFAAVVIMIVIVKLVDYTFLVGLIIFVSFIPLQTSIGRLSSVYKWALGFQLAFKLSTLIVGKITIKEKRR